jgi:Family of unknown function (DUF5681)
MSRDRKPGKSLAVRPGYEVGYAKPPTGTRFRPGQSGNPRGRPAGAKNKCPGLYEERLKDIILDEAYRGIAVRDGDRTVTIPVAQAIIRSMAINAAKGQHRAQQLFAELLVATEHSQKTVNDQYMKALIDYKVDWEEELTRRKMLGITNLPDPLPHPDHIEIDLRKGTGRIVGPITKEEKAAVDYWKRNMKRLFDELFELEDAKISADNPKERRKLERLYEEKSEFISFINRLTSKKRA